ncbi:Holliday junction branch migration protein RuvA [Natranaerofaba carboxydovora]|uniref:Holliday junction branch migration protein RuvA n=1 Tax=Natranaerofaba carboxydovora TaxID=2742683 RepID=UPI001F1321D9|nr:Holliday junction branch migration protein RuvA [Natranaerofaba carboxydovora]UMZ74023.1 Holliday junction ATP-dependent DNA helicase RuvA [Natranaerofaba carboxydovora]
MIKRIKGELIEKNQDFCEIMTGGIGYKVYISRNAYMELPTENETVMLHTYLMVKEDALDLYGFMKQEELAVFELVLNVSGIGPRIALEVLSTLTPKSFYLAVLNDEEVTLTKIPGIGKKSAKRIILELKERVKSIEVLNMDEHESVPQANKSGSGYEAEGAKGSVDNIINEAKAALNSLGYSDLEANRVLLKIKPEISSKMELEQVLKIALKSLQKG